MLEINYLAVLVCAVLSLVIGSVWYGPLFGKQWMEVMGMDMNAMTEEKKKEMQKGMWPMYATQFVLSLLQVAVLAYYINIGSWIDISGVCNALLIWVGFIVPTVAGHAMWNNNSNKIKWMEFGIQAGYQLVLFVVYGFILYMWV